MTSRGKGKGVKRLLCAGLLLAAVRALWAADVPAKSPYGPDDEIGALNEITPESTLAVLKRIKSGKVYDLSVNYFVGMPSFSAGGDQGFQIWMTHTPHGTEVDKPAIVPPKSKEKPAWSGDAISMYTHTGTHIDTLNHIGLGGAIYNGFRAADHLGDRGWKKEGAEKIPPIVTRGVLIDVAAAKGVKMLPDSYGITGKDIEEALAKQGTALKRGDTVVVRTGRMTVWPDQQKFMPNEPGITVDSAEWLVDHGAILIGTDNLSFEQFPVLDRETNWLPVHTYLLAERGVCIIEVMWLEELARDKVYEFAFIAAPLKFVGATGSLFRPIAIPIAD